MSYWNVKCGIVEFKEDVIVRHVTEAIRIGSATRTLSLRDFKFHRKKGVEILATDNVTDMFDKGMHYLDAVFLSSNIDLLPQVDWVEVGAEMKTQSNYIDVARGVFIWYFNLFTQARAIVPNEAQFLTSTLGLPGKTTDYVKALSSCNMELMPKSWIKKITFDKLSTEAKNRLALGCAGHRYLQALKYVPNHEFKRDHPGDIKFCRNLIAYTQGSLWWELHPITKSADLISVFGSLNKVLSTVLARSVKESFLKKLTASKVLYDMPREEMGIIDVETIDFEKLPTLTDAIFAKDRGTSGLKLSGL